jgi:hypothetical protein
MPKSKIEQVKTVELVFDPQLQMRQVEQSPDEYAEILAKHKGEWPFPELRAMRIAGEDGEPSRIYVFEGFTRGAAAIAAKIKTIPVEITDGTHRDALIAALASNATHGYRRTREDKIKAVRTALVDLKMNPTTAATECHVSRSFVYEVKAIIDSKTSATKAAKAKPAPTSELNEICPCCKSVNWVADNQGYICQSCRYVHGEPVGDSGEEFEPDDSAAPPPKPEPVTQSDAIVDAHEIALAKAEADRGRLIRSLENCGLLSICKSKLQGIGQEIERARRANKA